MKLNIDSRKRKLEGSRNGRLEILSYNFKTRKYLCKCDCGNIKEIAPDGLRNRRTKSCGCLLEERKLNLVGKKINMLTVLRQVENENGFSMFLCQCECGLKKKFRGKELNRNKVKSCGNHYKELISKANKTHGKTKTRLYQIHKGMLRRCHYVKDDSYESYGGRGIFVCEEWRGEKGFEKFEAWSFSNGYAKDLSIDRVDNNRGYSPDNCRWTDRITQANNVRANIMFTYNNQTMTLGQWCRKLNVKYDTVWKRIFKYNYSFEKAITHKIHIIKLKDKEG